MLVTEADVTGEVVGVLLDENMGVALEEKERITVVEEECEIEGEGEYVGQGTVTDTVGDFVATIVKVPVAEMLGLGVVLGVMKVLKEKLALPVDFCEGVEDGQGDALTSAVFEVRLEGDSSVEIEALPVLELEEEWEGEEVIDAVGELLEDREGEEEGLFTTVEDRKEVREGVVEEDVEAEASVEAVMEAHRVGVEETQEETVPSIEKLLLGVLEIDGDVDTLGEEEVVRDRMRDVVGTPVVVNAAVPVCSIERVEIKVGEVEGLELEEYDFMEVSDKEEVGVVEIEVRNLGESVKGTVTVAAQEGDEEEVALGQ